MYDYITGTVHNVCGSDLFDLKVMFQAKHNKASYQNNERIKISSTDSYDIDGFISSGSKSKLEEMLLGMVVKCKILKRDEEGWLLADIKIYGVN